MNLKKYQSVIISLAAGCLMTAAVSAKELPEATVINAANLDQVMNDTFEGHKIGDLLTEKFQLWVRDYGLNMKLAKSQELELAPSYLEATKKYTGQAKINGNMIENYTAGIPFPNLDVNDPECGIKAAYNHYHANPIIGNTWMAYGDVKIYDSKRGEIDNFGALSGKAIFDGVTIGEPKVGNPDDHAGYLLVLTRPYDISGIGVYNKQYNTGVKLDDGWVYLKALRRARRTAGGKSWMDPQPKMDLLNDDNQGILGHPSWFSDWKCTGTQTVLAVINSSYSPNMEFDWDYAVDEKTAPHWNPKNVAWEPRDVIIVETTPPAEHPYSKKVMYMDKDYPFFYHGEIYDKKGDFWRLWRQNYAKIKTCDGEPVIGFNATQAIDFQNERATHIRVDLMLTNCVDHDQFEPGSLKKAAAGSLESDMRKIQEKSRAMK